VIRPFRSKSNEWATGDALHAHKSADIFQLSNQSVLRDNLALHTCVIGGPDNDLEAIRYLLIGIQ
jgi:hypothetical protein